MIDARKVVDFSQRPEPLDASKPEGIYINPLFKYPQEPMSREMSEMFLTLNLRFADETTINASGLRADLENQFPYKVLEQRLHTMDVAFNVKAFLVLHWPSPGSLVMFAHSIYHSPRRKEGVQYDMEAFAHDFSMGFPNAQVMEFAWDAQKIKQGDNGLDVGPIFKATKEAPYTEARPGSVDA